MEEFIKVHQDCVQGVLHGFDRVVFRGTLRSVSHNDGLARYMNRQKIWLKDFKGWAQECTDRLSRAIEAFVKQAGRGEVLYVKSSKQSKEELAREVALRDGITLGLVMGMKCVEPCMTAVVRGNRASRRLEVRFEQRRCTFYYLYFIDEVFGWMHVRIQSWIPFDVQVCINGRSYLERELVREGIGHAKEGNCFTRIDNIEGAQGLMDKLERMNWSEELGRRLGRFWPRFQEGKLPEAVGRYYWSIRQSEVATDVMFKDKEALAAVYPRLCRHGIEGLGSEDVMRFFSREPSRFCGQVTTSCQKLVTGVRVKHEMGSNGIKMYDKAGSVLRVETTINDPRKLRVFRGTLAEPDKDCQWRAMAKAVGDIGRRMTISRQANERYLGSLAVVGRPVVTAAVLDPVARGVASGGKRWRGLRPMSPDDGKLMAAVMDGRHAIDGLSNGSVQALLFEDRPRDRREARRRSCQVGRQLRMLRQHGMIRKIGARRLYRVTDRGSLVMGLALAARKSVNVLALAA